MGYDVAIKRANRALEKQDRDPSLWPVPWSPFREFMIDCKKCGNRMAASAIKAHGRRCGS